MLLNLVEKRRYMRHPYGMPRYSFILIRNVMRKANIPVLIPAASLPPELAYADNPEMPPTITELII
jgi:hypothetical protein